MLWIIILSSRHFLKHAYIWTLTTTLLLVYISGNFASFVNPLSAPGVRGTVFYPLPLFQCASRAALRTYKMPGTLVHGHRSLATNAK